MALTKFGNMSIKSLLAPFADSFLSHSAIKVKKNNQILVLPVSGALSDAFIQIIQILQNSDISWGSIEIDPTWSKSRQNTYNKNSVMHLRHVPHCWCTKHAVRHIALYKVSIVWFRFCHRIYLTCIQLDIINLLSLN